MAAATLVVVAAMPAVTAAATATAGVDMPVAQFLGLGGPDIGDFDVELEVDPGQGVVGIDGNGIALDLGDLGHARTLWGLGLELHARLQVNTFRELGALGLDDQLRIVLAIGFAGRNLCHQLVADDLSFQLFLESGDDIAMPMQVGEGLLALAGVDDFPIGRS